MGDREAQALAKLTAGVGELRERVMGGLNASSSDIAFVLSGLERGPYLMARAKYLGDETVVKGIEIEGLLQASKFIRVTEPFRPGTIRGLVRLAMQETIAPQLCWSCAGRGDVPGRYSLAMQTCHVCGGSGYQSMATEDRMRFVEKCVDGFTDDDWPGWERSANRVYQMLSDWDVTAVRHIAGRLG